VLAFLPSPLRIFDLFDSVPQIQVKAPMMAKIAAMPAPKAFRVITERPLFNVDRKPDPLPIPPELPKPAITLGELTQYKVEGVISGGGTQLGLVRKTGAQPLTLKPGDVFDGWKVEKIDAKGIAISGGDRSEILAIPKAENGRPPP
jgi:general secretion pathway protein N